MTTPSPHQPDGGPPYAPAFPVIAGQQVYATGLTKRDWFAGQALAALISKAPFFDREGEHGKPVDLAQFKADMSVSAYAYADAMLAAQEGGAS